LGPEGAVNKSGTALRVSRKVHAGQLQRRNGSAESSLEQVRRGSAVKVEMGLGAFARLGVVACEVGASPDIPALSILEQRVAFFDNTLVYGSPRRLAQLFDSWHLGRQGLLELAVRHELGHALCNDYSEFGANQIAQQLERTKSIKCENRSTAKQK
jgi:hypothetical protein